jgi:hypothetical protein
MENGKLLVSKMDFGISQFLENNIQIHILDLLLEKNITE